MTVYTLFGQSGGGTNPSDATAYTMGVQFSVSQPGCTLTGIWFYSGSWATVLPQWIILYAVTGSSLIHQETGLTWSGAAGSGWVRAAFATPQSLTASTNYKAAVAQTTVANWYSATAAYWTSGVSNGPLSAPNNAGASPGQDSFTTSTPAYPDQTFNSSNYWVDPEITTSSTATEVPILISQYTGFF